MSRALSGRFTQVAKTFGKGLLTAGKAATKGLIGAVKGGGALAFAASMIERLLNPLQAAQEAIDRSLNRADDIETMANQFGTNAGTYAKLRALGGSVGLDAESFDTLLLKFQTALVEAAADPTKHSSVRNYIGSKDIATAFYDFVQNLQKIEDPEDRTLVQLEVFGEKQILKMAEFLQTDLSKRLQEIGGPSSKSLGKAISRTAEIESFNSALRERRNLDDIIGKSQVINKGTVQTIDRTTRSKTSLEDRDILNFENIAKLSTTVDSIFDLMKQTVTMVGNMVNSFVSIEDKVKKVSNSSFWRVAMEYWGRK